MCSTSSIHEFFLLFVVGDAGVGPLVPVVDAADCFCAVFFPSAKRNVALIVSLKSRTAAAQAVCHDTMLMLPSGALGNDNIHST